MRDYLEGVIIESLKMPPNVILKNIDEQGRYWITTDGRILSLCRETPHYLQFTDDNGAAYLYTKIDGEKVYLHRILAMSFNEDSEKRKLYQNCEVHHIDFDKYNNSLDNLCIVPPEKHRLIHRLFDKWEANLCPIE